MTLKNKRPRQDLNLESSDPKSDALSIRPRGRDDTNFTCRQTVMKSLSGKTYRSTYQKLQCLPYLKNNTE